jgi:rod shape-determining protein MreD
MAASADLQVGDLLVTSGLDGTYPPGLPVAKIVQIERKADTAFSRVYCEPVAGVRSHRQLLVVRYESGLAPRPPEAAPSQKAERGARSAAARAAPSRRQTRRRRQTSPRTRNPRSPHSDHFPIPAAPGQSRVHRADLRAGVPVQPDALGHHAVDSRFVALVLVFWNIHQPRKVGMGVAFLLGLLMDVHDARLLGEHALAYTLLAYFAITIHRRVLWFSVYTQALHVLPLLFIAHAVPVVIRLAWVRRCPAGAAAGAGDRGGAVADGHRAAAGAATPLERRRRDASDLALHPTAPAARSTAMTEIRNVELEIGRFRIRVAAAALFTVVCFGLLFARFLWLQWYKHDQYSAKAEDNRISVAPIEPNRGIIMDRNGVVLARNYSAYTLEITPSKLTDTLDNTIEELSSWSTSSRATAAASSACWKNRAASKACRSAAS